MKAKLSRANAREKIAMFKEQSKSSPSLAARRYEEEQYSKYALSKKKNSVTK